MNKRVLVLALCLAVIACSPRRDAVCSGHTLKHCEPSIYFAYDSARVSPYNYENLSWVARKLNRWSDRTVFLTGYADLRGGAAYNQTLSMRRARSVRDWLVNKGVPADRIFVSARGQHDPLTHKKELQDLNRRVDITFGYVPHQYHLTCND